ncbi:MAG: S41 family peptidase [Holosporales bacterium]|jgi:carboxyl-terminal processing protease|nr:S41 family peptidase [Holosporales bacterium]
MRTGLKVVFALMIGGVLLSSSKAKLPIPEEIKKSVPKDAQPYCLFNVILKHIKEYYVRPVDDDELVENALSGALSALDPHSCYLNKKALEVLKVHTEGTYGGLGIEVMMDNGLVRIISPIDGTPAYHAGLKAGDLITHIDGAFAQGVSSEEIVAKLRGAPGSKVRLKIKRPGKDLFEVTITRAIVLVHPVRFEFHEGIGYIRISVFDKNTTSELKTAIETLQKEKTLKGIVLDLRNNPGGLLEEAIGVSDLFMDGGEIVSVRGRKASMNETFSAKKGDLLRGLPIVVLVNSGTASAPEIVAGALQYHHRAVIVGTQTFGKGSVQKVVLLSPEGGIKMTVARHHTPSGRCIQAYGIMPDVVVPLAEVKMIEDTFIVREKDIPNALDASAANKPADKSEKEKLEIIEKTAQKSNKVKEKDEKKDEKGKKEGEDGDKETEKDAGKDTAEERKMSVKERLEKDLQLIEAFSIVRALSVAHSTMRGVQKQ